MESTGKILSRTFGQNKFTFEVSTIFTKSGTQRYVHVIQETFWTPEDIEIFGVDMPNCIIKRKFYFPVSTSEFGAIDLAGKKLIACWDRQTLSEKEKSL